MSRRTSASMPVRYCESETSRASSPRSAWSAGTSPSTLLNYRQDQPVADRHRVPARPLERDAEVDVTRALPSRRASVAR